MPWLAALRTKIYKSPNLRTFVSVVLSVLVGVFSNTFVTEITSDEGLQWAASYRTFSFWALSASAVLTFWFYRHMHAYEADVAAFKDADYCMAYARSQLIPAQVSAAKTQIASGDTDKFKAAMKELKDALK